MLVPFQIHKPIFSDDSGSTDLNAAVLEQEGGCVHLPVVLREGHATALEVPEPALASPCNVVERLKGYITKNLFSRKQGKVHCSV